MFPSNFNPPAPCGAGHSRPLYLTVKLGISIHPPRAGRDKDSYTRQGRLAIFQSTRPVRGGTSNTSDSSPNNQISIHPPRAGRDRIQHNLCHILLWISIHPPRAGRDVRERFPDFDLQRISIHPPRAGRDLSCLRSYATEGYFNPPAPCGAGRQMTLNLKVRNTFQSTRPVRGGTAIIYKHTSVIYCTIYNNALKASPRRDFLPPCVIILFAMRIKFRCEVRGVFPGASPSHGQIIRTPSGLYPAFTPKCSVFVS